MCGACSSPPSDSVFSEATNIPSAQNNPLTPSGIALGKSLFFETSLSGNGKQSCATCHVPDSGFTHPDYRLKRAIPTLWNLAWSPFFFWDGSQENLESMIFLPLTDSLEMHGRLFDAARNLQKIPRWRKAFGLAFGSDTVYAALISRALAQYVRTLVFPMPDTLGFSQFEKDGFLIFQNQCANCHGGKFGTDFKLRKSVLAASGTDLGRYPVTRSEKDKYVFKTPGLAQISKTAPYMHNNSIPDLDSLIKGYSRNLSGNYLKNSMEMAKLKAYLLRI